MRTLLALGIVAVLCAPASATVYSDTTGDTFTGAGGGILDIVQLEVTNNATDITFKFTLAGDVVATDWGKYMVAIDRVAGGDTAGNGWGRPISMPSGMDIWLGSWVDGSMGVETRTWDGAGWPLTNFTTPSKSGNMVTLTLPLASLGLAINDTFTFDAFTSGGGGGDGAIDSAANPAQTVGDWGHAYAVQNPLSYTVVPEPGTLALLGLGAYALIRRRR